MGQWSAVQPWPVIAIHANLLPSGKVLAWDATRDDQDNLTMATGFDGTNQNTTAVTLWDPITNQHTRVDSNTQSNLFCAGHANLPDGNVLVAGGNTNGGLGIVATNIFDRTTNTWSRVQDMTEARWYPAVTPLANGEMLVTAGTGFLTWKNPEVWTTARTWRSLTEVWVTDFAIYPWQHVAPNGQVFRFGPDDDMGYIDSSSTTGSWTPLGSRGDGIFRGYGSFAMYDVGKILVAGGDKSESTAVIIDLINGPACFNPPCVTPTAPMLVGRRQHNLTIFPDGRVLATGGNWSGANAVDLNAAANEAEVWDPDTGQWTLWAAENVTCQYHSTALLLPDGRVVSAGGVCGACDPTTYHNLNAEYFSPPYLFKKDGSGELAPRPTISSVPGSISYGRSFKVGSPQAASIQRVALLRPSSVTHSTNMEQRFVPLTFDRSGGALRVTALANRNNAPPGYYMLFILNGNNGNDCGVSRDNCVPSSARMIRLK